MGKAFSLRTISLSQIANQSHTVQLIFMGYCSCALICESRSCHGTFPLSVHLLMRFSDGFAGGSTPPADLDQAGYETCVKV